MSAMPPGMPPMPMVPMGQPGMPPMGPPGLELPPMPPPGPGPDAQPSPIELAKVFEEPLLDLRRKYTNQYAAARREQVKKVEKARRYWEGDQNITWNDFIGTWVGISSLSGQQAAGEPQEAQEAYVVNRVRAYGMSFIALVRANRPTMKWLPDSRGRRTDVRAAEAADDFMRHYERVNKIQDELEQEALRMWTDGVYGSYVRYVEDGDRFGWTSEPILGERPVKLGEDTYQCPCGMDTPAPESLGVCPACLGQHTPEMMQEAPTVMSQYDTGQVKKRPKGRVIRDVVGALELFLPMLATRQDEMPFVARSFEADRYHVMQRWPHVKDKLDTEGSGSDETNERAARLAMMGGAGVSKKMSRSFVAGAEYITLSTWWFRPWAFNAVDEEYRDQLKQIFPRGCKATFAGDVLVEVEPESMDDHWRFCKAMPGDGFAGAAIATDSVPLQEMFNDIVNLVRDNVEYTMPIVFVDPQTIDLRRLAKTQVRGGAMYNAATKPGQAMSASILQTQPGQLPAYAAQLMGLTGDDWMQHMTGVFPASFGGSTGSNDTAHGIAIERDQAMGRIGMHWGQIREHHADWAPLAVAIYAEHGDEIILSDDGGAERVIDPEAIRNGQYHVTPETTVEFPVTWAQKRQALMGVLQTPQGGALLGVLGNAPKIKASLGLDVEWPGEGNYQMQMDEIEVLLAGEPQEVIDPVTGVPVIDPMTGQPQMQSSVPVEPDVEDHIAQLQAIKDWWVTRDAKVARRDRPKGVQNVLLHGKQHAMIVQQQAMAQMMAAPPQNGGAGNGQNPSTKPGTLEEQLETQLPETR